MPVQESEEKIDPVKLEEARGRMMSEWKLNAQASPNSFHLDTADRKISSKDLLDEQGEVRAQYKDWAEEQIKKSAKAHAYFG
ncbi:MAG: hypothetical protein K9G62_02460 [Alphaproteobacteria bacterium]|nr:hypothetical protein [Alphaproteobacteria bacterium]